MGLLRSKKWDELIGVLVAAAGVLVVAGWAWDIDNLKSFFITGPPMKLISAESFIAAGCLVWLTARETQRPTDLGSILIPLCSSILLLIMTGIVVASVLGIRTGLEDQFASEATGEKLASESFRPSLGSITAFYALGLSGLFLISGVPGSGRMTRAMGAVACCVGAVALAGHVLNLPGLYYTVEGWSGGMAVSTAFLLVLSGASVMHTQFQG